MVTFYFLGQRISVNFSVLKLTVIEIILIFKICIVFIIFIYLIVCNLYTALKFCIMYYN